MSEAIVVFNAGSTSLKFAAYAVDAARTSAATAALRGPDRQHAGRSAFRRQRRGRQAAGRA